jgi:hypothetical protein
MQTGVDPVPLGKRFIQYVKQLPNPFCNPLTAKAFFSNLRKTLALYKAASEGDEQVMISYTSS